MQVVIEMSDDYYEILKYEGQQPNAHVFAKLVANGTVLPKGHGDLIDRSKIYKAIPAEEDNCTGMGMTLEEMDEYNNGIDAMYALVKGAKPIIEADTGSEVQDADSN